MQIALKPLSDDAKKRLEEHGMDWIIKKFHPNVQAFGTAGCWVESIKTKEGMWLRVELQLSDHDTLEDPSQVPFIVNDSEYKHIL